MKGTPLCYFMICVSSGSALVFVRLHALDSAVSIVLNLAEHYATLMVNTTG